MVLSETTKYWVGFNQVKGIGAVRLKSLLGVFGDIRTAWHVSYDDLIGAGLNKRVAGNFIDVRSSVDLDQVVEDILQQGIKILTWEDDDYPVRLKDIPNSPPVIYYRGEFSEADDWAVAIVGTRRMSSYGQEVAERVARAMAGNGVTVVSGLARGVDSVAHKAALEAGGRTIAVLGNGVDRVYPPENRKLFGEILENGVVLSDYIPGTPPDAGNFPPRNRIISGLSRAVVVVEAGIKSGAIITAKYTADHGRDVFAVPGNIYAPQSKGTNYLVQNGAHPLLHPKDILDVLDLSFVVEQTEARVILPADAVEAKLYDLLGLEPMHVDEIHAKMELPIEDVSASLALMELKGMVRQVGEMRYMAVREETGSYS